MSYDVTVMKLSTNQVRVVIESESGDAHFDMVPEEARRFAFGVIEASNEIDHPISDEDHPSPYPTGVEG